MGRKKVLILTNDLFSRLVLKYIIYCDEQLKYGLPTYLSSYKSGRDRLDELMNRIGVNPRLFWTKFDTMLDNNLLEVGINKSIIKSRKSKYYVKIR